MANPIQLDPKKTCLILIDMINAVAKGAGPPYDVPPNRQEVIQNFQKLVAHCRSVGGRVPSIHASRGVFPRDPRRSRLVLVLRQPRFYPELTRTRVPIDLTTSAARPTSSKKSPIISPCAASGSASWNFDRR